MATHANTAQSMGIKCMKGGDLQSGGSVADLRAANEAAEYANGDRLGRYDRRDSDGRVRTKLKK